MRTLIIALALAATACNRPPRTTEDGKTCTWDREGIDTTITEGTCIKSGQVYTCLYHRNGDPQVVCGATCPMPAEVRSTQ
jgi:hypothetical protein